jgi:predicted methyltransferase
MRVNPFRSTIVALGIVLTAGTAWAQSTSNAAADRIRAAIAHDLRPAVDRARDSNRKPLETLLFFGLREDMTVLELVPAGGWFTKIIGQVLADEG